MADEAICRNETSDELVAPECSPTLDTEIKGSAKTEHDEVKIRELHPDVTNNTCQEGSDEVLSVKTSNGVDDTAKEHGMDHANLHYEGEICIYTDPESKFQYVWDGTKNEWTPRLSETASDESVESSKHESKVSAGSDLESKTFAPDHNSLCPSSNEEFSSKDYKFDGESYVYTDSQTGVTYKYDNDKSTWILKDTQAKDTKEEGSVESDSEEDEDTGVKVIRQDMTTGHYSYEGDNHLYTDPTDGSVYIWDREKNAWFPKVDDDFLAQYQMNYGFTDPNANQKPEEEIAEKDEDPEEEQDLKRKAPQPPTWFEMDEQHNTKVYVSNLPSDITEQEFVDIMQKCGLVMRDVDSGKMKVKMYTESNSTQLKGDALCTYIKVESVDLAVNLLDGYDLRGHKLKVERAKFQMKGSYDPSLKPKKRRKKDKEKLKKMQEKLFDWRPDKLRGERSKNEKVVIIKNLFDPAIFDKEVSLILEYQQDLREECSKCGTVRKVIIYDRHAEGVAQVSFSDAEEADLCIKLLNGRWFGQRKITAETWDGKTKYKVVETEEEKQKRLQKWGKFLETGEQPKEASVENSSNVQKSIGATSSEVVKEEASSKAEIRKSDTGEESSVITDSDLERNNANSVATLGDTEQRGADSVAATNEVEDSAVGEARTASGISLPGTQARRTSRDGAEEMTIEKQEQ